VSRGNEKEADSLFNEVLKIFFRVFLKSIPPARRSASIAEEITTTCFIQLSNLICRDNLVSLKYAINPLAPSHKSFPDEFKLQEIHTSSQGNLLEHWSNPSDCETQRVSINSHLADGLVSGFATKNNWVVKLLLLPTSSKC
jgi:hypothetical protein